MMSIALHRCFENTQNLLDFLFKAHETLRNSNS